MGAQPPHLATGVPAPCMRLNLLCRHLRVRGVRGRRIGAPCNRYGSGSAILPMHACKTSCSAVGRTCTAATTAPMQSSNACCRCMGSITHITHHTSHQGMCATHAWPWLHVSISCTAVVSFFAAQAGVAMSHAPKHCAARFCPCHAHPLRTLAQAAPAAAGTRAAACSRAMPPVMCRGHRDL